jgi:hypothetical protein
MGIAYNTSIVTNGLVWYLDAANPRCYSGSGLTSNDLIGGIGGSLAGGVGFSSANYGTFTFDGSNDYITIADNSLLNTFTNMTLEVVVKYTTTNNQIFAQKWNYVSGSQGYTIEIFSSTIAAACYAGGSYPNVPVSSYPINNVYHIILTLSGSTQTLYINGISVASTSGGSIPSLSGTDLRIGGRSGGNSPNSYLGGNVYLTKFYNRALSAAEIKTNYNAAKGRYGL